MQKTLQELNLIDDFLFFVMLNDEVIGEEFGRYLLEIIFDRKFGKLNLIPLHKWKTGKSINWTKRTAGIYGRHQKRES